MAWIFGILVWVVIMYVILGIVGMNDRAEKRDGR